MKKYMKYLALCAVVAMGGYVTSVEAGFIDDMKAKASSLKNKVKNAVDECNASAGASPKGLKVGEKCLADEATAKKNKNFAAAYWGTHCNAGNPGGDGDETLCATAFEAMTKPEGFTGCNPETAASTDPKVKAMFAKICVDNAGVLHLAVGNPKKEIEPVADVKQAEEDFYKLEGNCVPDGDGKTDKKLAGACKKILKALPEVAA